MSSPRRRIFLVEDNEDNRLLAGVILRARYEVVEFADGYSALEGIRAAPPDLVLLDISLPGMDGMQVLAELRADSELATIPVIALTAHAMRGDRERLLEHGFDAYVAKPILEEEDLFAEIERLTGEQA